MMRRLVTIFAVVFTVMIATPTVAWGQDNGGGYGYDTTCNQIHDKLDVGLPGLPSIGDGVSAVCKGSNVATHPGQAVDAVADKAWDSTFGKVVDSLMKGLGQAITLSLTFWTKVPNDRLLQNGVLLNKINDYTYQAQYLLLIASVILTGARLAEARRGAAMNEAAETFRMFARVVFASWMLSAIIVAGTQVSDKFSAWLIEDSTGGKARNIAELMVKTSKLQAFSPGLVLIIAIVGLLGSLAQVVLAVVRQGLLVVAAGFLPMAAAASGMKTGAQSYQKLLGWVIAFLLWKPVAAMVYMIAFVTAGDVNDRTSTGGLPDPDQAQRMLVGVVLLCSVAFVLPALMRLVAPAVAIVGTGGSGLNAAGAAIIGAAALSIGGKSVGVRGAAAPGRAGYVPPRGTRPPGGGGRGPGGGGGGGPRGGPGPVPGQPQSGGGAAAGAVPAGGKGAVSGVASRMAAARNVAANIAKAHQVAEDHLAGDQWVNRSPDLGRSTIPR